jgi:hypothetical protein
MTMADRRRKRPVIYFTYGRSQNDDMIKLEETLAKIIRLAMKKQN